VKRERISPRPVSLERDRISPRPVLLEPELKRGSISPRPVSLERDRISPRPVSLEPEIPKRPTISPRPVITLESEIPKRPTISPRPVVLGSEIVVTVQQRVEVNIISSDPDVSPVSIPLQEEETSPSIPLQEEEASPQHEAPIIMSSHSSEAPMIVSSHSSGTFPPHSGTPATSPGISETPTPSATPGISPETSETPTPSGSPLISPRSSETRFEDLSKFSESVKSETEKTDLRTIASPVRASPVIATLELNSYDIEQSRVSTPEKNIEILADEEWQWDDWKEEQWSREPPTRMSMDVSKLTLLEKVEDASTNAAYYGNWKLEGKHPLVAEMEVQTLATVLDFEFNAWGHEWDHDEMGLQKNVGDALTHRGDLQVLLKTSHCFGCMAKSLTLKRGDVIVTVTWEHGTKIQLKAQRELRWLNTPLGMI